MKTPTASSATSSQREQTSLLSQMPRSPRSNVCSTPDPENPSASVHPKRFSTPSLTLKFLCAGKLNPRNNIPLNAIHPTYFRGSSGEYSPPFFRSREGADGAIGAIARKGADRNAPDGRADLRHLLGGADPV